MLDAAVALTHRRVVILVDPDSFRLRQRLLGSQPRPQVVVAVGLTQDCVVAYEAAARAMVVGTGTRERVP
jgi:hypothetical protein